MFNITPILLEGYVNIYGRDITERKKSEIALNLEKKFADDILNSSMDTVFVFNPESGKAVRWNNVFQKVCGYSYEEISSMKAPESYYSKEDLERASEAIKNVLEKGRYKVEMSLITKDGRSILYEYTATALEDSSGDTLIVSVGRDISERKIAEEALKQSEKKYKEAYDRGNFYKDLFAHDINNILQVINSSAELITYQLGGSEKSKEIANISDIIMKQVSRGAKLISNVRTLSELEEKEIITRRVEISSVLKNSIIFVEKAYEGRNVNISLSSIEGDYFTNANELLQDVFENVLINGIKYNEHSNIDILIKSSKQKIDTKNYIKIEFIDNGIGVSNERKDVIFSSGNRELKGSKGMGLGLSLVSKILTVFKGEIRVEDKIKGDYTKGSNFIILLPEI
jgi:PAS domain S-box-containing protein